MKAFWWNDRPNLGDQLTPILLQHFLGVDVQWAPASKAGWVAVGSIIPLIPSGWTGTVWGIGKMRERDSADLSQARVLALRGRLTAGDIRCALGDPGLLVSLLPGIDRTPLYELGVVAHWQDRGLYWNHRGRRINTIGDPWLAIRDIARSKRIVSSSLHGIVLADAFGIERKWIRSRQATEFKFRDYGTVVGAFEPGVWVTADGKRIRQAQADLLSVLPLA